jgi:hypothetical protein
MNYTVEKLDCGLVAILDEMGKTVIQCSSKVVKEILKYLG